MDRDSKDKRVRYRVPAGEPVPMFAPPICLSINLRQRLKVKRNAQDCNPSSSVEEASTSLTPYLTPPTKE